MGAEEVEKKLAQGSRRVRMEVAGELRTKLSPNEYSYRACWFGGRVWSKLENRLFLKPSF